MKLTLRELRRLIREDMAGSSPSEAYGSELSDDPALKKHSILVPDRAKRAIKKWSRALGLSQNRNKRSCSA